MIRPKQSATSADEESRPSRESAPAPGEHSTNQHVSSSEITIVLFHESLLQARLDVALIDQPLEARAAQTGKVLKDNDLPMHKEAI